MRLSALPFGSGNPGLAATFAIGQEKRRSPILTTLVLCASILAVASGLALAETTLPKEPTNEQPVMTSSSSSLSRDHWLASDVYKAGVYDTSEHRSEMSPIF
jgi:hypothetical protein